MYLGKQNYSMVNAGIDLPHNYISTVNPTIDVNPPIINMTWLNSVTGEIFVCTGNSTDNNTWVPNVSILSLSPCLWLDCSDTGTMYDDESTGSIVLEGGNILRIEDKSSFNNHATVITGTDTPTRDDSNVRSTASFSGSSALSIGTVTSLGIESIFFGHTIISVSRSDDDYALSSNYSGTGHNVIGMATQTPVNLRGGTASTHTATFATDTNFKVDVHLYAGTGKPFTAYRNGSKDGTVRLPADGMFTDTGSFESGYDLTLGRWGELSSYLIGDIGEFIIFPYEMSETAIIYISNLLMLKWGIKP